MLELLIFDQYSTDELSFDVGLRLSIVIRKSYTLLLYITDD